MTAFEGMHSRLESRRSSIPARSQIPLFAAMAPSVVTVVRRAVTPAGVWRRWLYTKKRIGIGFEYFCLFLFLLDIFYCFFRCF